MAARVKTGGRGGDGSGKLQLQGVRGEGAVAQMRAVRPGPGQEHLGRGLSVAEGRSAGRSLALPAWVGPPGPSGWFRVGAGALWPPDSWAKIGPSRVTSAACGTLASQRREPAVSVNSPKVIKGTQRSVRDCWPHQPHGPQTADPASWFPPAGQSTSFEAGRPFFPCVPAGPSVPRGTVKETTRRPGCLSPTSSAPCLRSC